MAIKEVFSQPTVQQVIFEIKFPNYFGIDSKIGDFQLLIMSKFPKSKLLFKQQFGILGTVNKANIPTDFEDKIENPPMKIWQFNTESEEITLNVTTGSLDISSKKHKTYNNNGVEQDEKFRETIIFVITQFLSIIPLKLFSRMGLRYIDRCPLPDPLTLKSFLQYYNSSINFKNINTLDINSIEVLKNELIFIKGNNRKVKHSEILAVPTKEYELDFDGMAYGVNSEVYLTVLDDIHNDISECFEKAINEPVYKLMREKIKS